MKTDSEYATSLERAIEKNIGCSIIQYLLVFSSQIKIGGDLMCHGLGITAQQWFILLHLANDPNMPFFYKSGRKEPVLASELAQHLNVSRANITNLLNTLLEKDLVVQVSDEKDRRRKFLQLSEKGNKVVNALEPVRRGSNDKLFATFSPEEKVMFFMFLERCVTYLARRLPEWKRSSNGVQK